MSHRHSSNAPAARRILPLAGAAALVAALTVSSAPPAQADAVTPPAVPGNIQVPAGNVASLVGHAVGTQNYVCLPIDNVRFGWTLFTPQATLFDDASGQLTTHFFSPNPFEAGAVRPTWQHSGDTSAVWGQAVASSTDASYVAPGALSWLLIHVVGAAEGPTGGGSLAAATYIQRVNTTGGLAPATGCSSKKDVGMKVFVPYTADYFFFAAE
jgi:hypothetical protein